MKFHKRACSAWFTYCEQANDSLPLSPAEEFPVGAKSAGGRGGLVALSILLGKGPAAYHEGCLLLLRVQWEKSLESAAQHERANHHAACVDRSLQEPRKRRWEFPI